jgi:hypothetical protein
VIGQNASLLHELVLEITDICKVLTLCLITHMYKEFILMVSVRVDYVM